MGVNVSPLCYNSIHNKLKEKEINSMPYTYNSFNNRPANKWETIQSDIADAYIYLDEEEIQVSSDESDPFGFADAISIDHLTDEQVDKILAMFGE
jgi:hypothetical protein